jgi:hypothetical protein
MIGANPEVIKRKEVQAALNPEYFSNTTASPTLFKSNIPCIKRGFKAVIVSKTRSEMNLFRVLQPL